ncbi:MAG: carboxypeptidase-like regulatory domain-containing protein [Bacteroidota bacterium]
MHTSLLQKCLLWGMLMTCALSQGQAQSIQELKVQGGYSDQPLSFILMDLGIRYQLTFVYQKSDVQGITFDRPFGRKPLGLAMKLFLANTDLDFKLVEPRTVLVFKKEEAPEIEVPEAPKREPTQFNFTVSGQVRDLDSGESLPYARVRVVGGSQQTLTNVDGYFTLFNLPADTSLLEASYVGRQKKYFRLEPGMAFEKLQILMDNPAYAMEAVLIEGEKEEQLIRASTGISRISVSPDVLNSLPSFGEKDIFRSLQLLPGVSGTNESSSGLYVRGGTPDQNLILFDGFTVYHVDHLFGFFSAFNAQAVKDVQLSKGGFEAKYGGRLSSVVELTGKDGNTQEFNAGAGLSLLSANAFVESPFAGGKGSFFVAGRRSFQSDFYTNLFDAFTSTNPNGTEGGQSGFAGPGGRFGQLQTQPNTYFYDLNAKLSYQPSPKDKLSLSFYNGQDNLDNSRELNNLAFAGGPFGANANFSFNSDNTDLSNWGNWGGSGKWSRKWSERFYSNALLSYSNYFSQRDRRNETSIVREDTTIERTNGTYENNDLKDISFKLDNELKLSAYNQLDFGLQSTYNDIQYEFTQNDTLSLINRADQGYTHALYLQDRHIFFKKLSLTAGLRATYYQPTDSIYLEPRLAATYQLTPRLRLKGAWGTYNQFATRIVREDIQQGSRDFWLLADGERVPTGFAEHRILGLSYETPVWLFDVEAYTKNYDGLSEYTTRLATTGRGPDRTLAYDELFYTGTGQARGVEVLLQKKTGKLTGWLGYTLSEVKYDFEAFGDEPFFANQDQTHELKIVANYKWRAWDFAATFVYATGRPYTAPTGYYELELLDGTTSSFFEISDKNALRLPNYHRADLSATYQFDLGAAPTKLGLSLFNLYNRQNVWYNEYEVIEGELLETQISLLGFTPSLFLSISLH